MEASDWTPHKQDAYGHYLRPYAAIVSMIQRKYPSWGSLFHFELTGGPGSLKSNDGPIKGSPLIALEVFRNTPRLAVDCLFTEQNPIYAKQLGTAIVAEQVNWSLIDRSRLKVQVQCVDHRSVLKSNTAARGSLGLLYWDGLGRDIYPSAELRDWLTRHTKHDLLIMGSGTAQKRSARPRFDRMLLTVPRNEVWVSDPYGSWQWVFAIATNWPPLPQKLSDAGIVLHRWNSERGKAIRDILGMTRNERGNRHQMPLWSEYRTYEEYLRHPKYLAVRAEALRLADGFCERCGARATEVHHLRYPPWGEFDVVENLLAVCHPCHCWIEGKET